MGISAGVGGGGGTAFGGGVLAFEWNRLDLSQFVSGGAMDFASGGGGGAWSVAAIAERDNALVYTPAGGTSVAEIAMFSKVLDFPTERRDMRVELEVHDHIPGGGGYFGPFFYGDADTPLHGVGHMCSPSEWEFIMQNGGIASGGGTGGQVARHPRFNVRGRKPSGAPPEVTSYLEGWTTTGGNGRPRRSGSTSAIRGGVEALGNGLLLGATWNATNCDRFGIAIRSSGGNPPPTQVRILNFRVYVI